MIIYNAHKNFHGKIRMSIALGVGVGEGGGGEHTYSPTLNRCNITLPLYDWRECVNECTRRHETFLVQLTLTHGSKVAVQGTSAL